MWLVTTLIAALAVTAMHFGIKRLRGFRLDFLALMLWGTFVMVLVDHAIAFAEGGGEIIEVTTDGLVASGLMLGILMIAPLALVWAVAALAPLGAGARAGREA
ncbi:MAG: hypothetical protein PHF51_04125 [Candidatus ainarchaeum sp.]|nr:hypothetical protein [Candidatus ainarchaeum sp.]